MGSWEVIVQTWRDQDHSPQRQRSLPVHEAGGTWVISTRQPWETLIKANVQSVWHTPLTSPTASSQKSCQVGDARHDPPFRLFLSPCLHRIPSQAFLFQLKRKCEDYLLESCKTATLTRLFCAFFFFFCSRKSDCTRVWTYMLGKTSVRASRAGRGWQDVTHLATIKSTSIGFISPPKKKHSHSDFFFSLLLCQPVPLATGVKQQLGI